MITALLKTHRFRGILKGALLVLVMLSAPGTTLAEPVPDPLQPFNRAMFTFNDVVDRAVFRPLAVGYRAVLPQRVRNGVNNFFNNLKEQHKAQDKEFEENLKLKEKFLKEVEGFKNSGDTKKDVEQIKGFINSWKELGKVPRKNIKTIEGTFRKLIDAYFEQLDMDKAEKRDIQYKSKIEAIVAEDDKSKLSEELFKLQQSAKKCKEELSLLENNISFFKNAKDDNPLLKEVRKNIERQKEKFEEIKTRMAFVKSI